MDLKEAKPYLEEAMAEWKACWDGQTAAFKDCNGAMTAIAIITLTAELKRLRDTLAFQKGLRPVP